MNNLREEFLKHLTEGEQPIFNKNGTAKWEEVTLTMIMTMYDRAANDTKEA